MNKISLKNGYTLTENEDGSIFLKVETEDEILELDGIEGNLMAASDFESHLSEDEEPMEFTAAELKNGALSFLEDWGADTETAEAIIEDLAEWFDRYGIEEPKADAWLKVLEGRAEELRKQTEAHEDNVNKTIEQFREWVSSASDFDLFYGAEGRSKKITSAKETYKASWDEYKKAESELRNYKDTMHIR